MVKILKNFDNKLLNRKEVKLIVKHPTIPDTKEALVLVSKEFNSEEDLIVVKGIKGKFGRDTFLIESFIYDTLEDKNKIEVNLKEPAKPAQEIKEEQPVEEKKEEKPAEEKSEEIAKSSEEKKQ